MSSEQEIRIEEETIVEEEIQIVEEETNVIVIEPEKMEFSNDQKENNGDPHAEIAETKNEEEPETSKLEELTVEPESSKLKISFGVTMQTKKKIERTNLLVHEDEEPEMAPKRMKLTHFENGVATGHEEETIMMKKKKTDYVIPMIVRNDWRIERLRKMEEDGTITEEDRARLAIMVEAQGEAQIVAEERSVGRQVIVYNPEEIEAPEDADYSQMPIEHFGLAILRGCGWKEGEGIGKTNKKAIPLKLPELRPKGLGLGAQLPKIQTKKVESDKPEDQIKPLGRGSFVKVVGDASSTKKSKYLHRYGVVKGMDEDNSSCMVELAIDHTIVRISQFLLEPVSEKEYKKKSRILNADKYDRVKQELDKSNDEEKNGRSSPQIRKTSSRRDLEEYEKSKRIKEEYPSESSSKMWAVPNLRVRFVDKRYKDGAYFKQKMVVVEAADKYNIELRDDKGKMHYNIKQTWLETVIPKGIGARVRIVNGLYKNQIGLIAEREDKKERLWVRLLNSDDLVKVSYDDACEWVGNEEELY